MIIVWIYVMMVYEYSLEWVFEDRLQNIDSEHWS